MKKKVTLLDTTLRDGSYTIGHQFSLLDNSIISHGLEKAGVKYIEIGHGTGLGTNKSDNNAQAYSDKKYMECVRASLKTAEFGFFFIPGIGNQSDIKLLAENGGRFIRMGVSYESFPEAKKYLTLSKKLNLKCWINLMKSYAYKVEEFGQLAKMAFLEGASGVYLVDSAGGMMPKDVYSYINKAADVLLKEGAKDFDLGFHGHENLSLGIGCSLAAVEAGATIVDGSLLGIGRSIGNSAIETLAMVFDRYGYDTGVDPWSLSDLAQETIKPYLVNRWRNSSLEQASGYKQIHSTEIDKIIEFAKKNEVNPRDLLLSLRQETKLALNNEHLSSAKETLRQTIRKPKIKSQLKEKIDGIDLELQVLNEPINKYLQKIISIGLRTNRKTVLVLSASWDQKSKNEVLVQKIKTIADFEIGSIEVSDISSFKLVDSSILNQIDYFICDTGLDTKSEWVSYLKDDLELKVFPFSDKCTIYNHIIRFLLIKQGELGYKLSVFFIVENEKDNSFLVNLAQVNGIEISKNLKSANTQILISGSQYHNLKKYDDLKLVLDVRSRLIDQKSVQYAVSNGIEILAIDCEAAVLSEVIAAISTGEGIQKHFGSNILGDVNVVAKGKWGMAGDVVVDSVDKPSLVLGIADGIGGVQRPMKESDEMKIDKVIKFLISRKMQMQSST